MTLHEILKTAVENGASDIFLIAGLPVTYKIKGVQLRDRNGFLKPADILPMRIIRTMTFRFPFMSWDVSV